MYKNIPFDINTHPFCYAGYVYAKDVVTKKIPACIYVIGACKRYIDDLAYESAPFYFDADYAERYLRLVQKFEHTIGHWPTKNIVYEPWQNWLFSNLMGFFDKETQFRRFRIAHIEIPRGQGKSVMASQCALFFLALDKPNGNMIANVATKREQARIVLDASRAMAMKSKAFLKDTGVKVLAHTITHRKSNSIIRALSSDTNGLDGLNDVLAVCDELHAMPREVFEVIYSGMSKRQDSLTLCITTAGFDTDSVGYSQSIYARKVCERKIIDDQFFAVIYTIDQGDDIWEESTWRKTNPGYGISVDAKTFKAKAMKAQTEPKDVPNFKVKHLNIWLSEMAAFFDMDKWDSCADPSLRLEDFIGKKVKMGVDISSHLDLSALGYVFREKDIYYIFDRTYIPEATVKRLRNVLYDECIASGQLIQTKGEAIDQDNIKNQIIADSKIFKIDDLNVDPWNTIALMQALNKNHIPTTEFRMNVANLSEPLKQFDTAIRQGRVRHNGSRLLSWQASNLVAKEDANGNIYPRKNNEKLKIDTIISILLGFASWLQDGTKESVYNSRTSGLRHF